MRTQTATELPATNEIVSALLAAKYADDQTLLQTVRDNPQTALNGSGVAVTVRAVQNTEDTLHICVPDYEVLADMKLDDEQLAQVSGGEIFISIGIAISAAFVVGTVATVVGVKVAEANREE
ncbi:MAG: hypothetical protein OXU44_04400, partial [Gammaproteobacteria bacterium]|nr:hypothetical protein [Gammaproteobacteria bacterium]